MLLETRQIRAGYGRHRVVNDVNLNVARGELVALLGANGVGKTTTLSAICGLIRPSAGDVLMDGRSITGLSPAQAVGHGLVLCPQGRELFKSMTVRENLVLGGVAASGDDGEALERVFTLFPRLRERDRQVAGTLSGGEQQMLAIGRSLMARPRLLLIDEPSLGLAPQMVELVLDLMRDLIPNHVEGILLVEQNADAALQIADRAYLMQAGAIEVGGTAEQLRGNDVVREMYLGAGDD